VADRAHNVVLDHLVTGGLIGVALWFALVASLLTVGIARLRGAGTPAEVAVRGGALGAIAAHVVEGQVGIATPVPLALFWVAAAVCALPAWSPAPRAATAPSPRRAPWVAAAVVMGLALVLVAWFETRWLLASVAYAEGVQTLMAGRAIEAQGHFERSRRLVPLLALPAEAAASTAFRRAAAEADGSRRRALLEEAEGILAEPGSRRHPSATAWTLRAQVAFALVRAGERDRMRASLEAFDQAARLRPWDGQILSQFAWALVEAGQPRRARATARRALEETGDREEWLLWAVLARSARDLGESREAERAAAAARRLAPPHARAVVESLLSG
jgi:hypothetical protein